MDDDDTCTPETLHASLVYLEQVARGLGLYSGAQLIAAAALETKGAMAVGEDSDGQGTLIVSNVSKRPQ